METDYFQRMEEDLNEYINRFGMSATLAVLSGLAEDYAAIDEENSMYWEDAAEAIDQLALTPAITTVNNI